jgi:sugar-phosphatase
MPLAEVRLRAAGLPIPDIMITASDIQNGKPHPEPYLKAAAMLGYSPADCVVLEDVPAGIRSGKSAGARVIAFPTTVSKLELINEAPDWVLIDCRAIAVSSTGGDLALTLDGA